MNFSDEEDSDHEEPQLESWVRIQRNTFTNWVNDKLRVHDLEVNHLHKDFKDGVKLCKLMEALKGKRIGRIIQKAKLNKYEASGNLQLAFNAMAKDGVRLVNIGAEDVTSGNIKLILGLLWTLIRRYQIGSQSKLPPKAMMLSWCNAVLHPHRRVNNFSTDWNDGIALHGLLDYCRPGSCGSWHQMSAADGLANTQHAMRLADEQFDIPMVMRPEDLADPDVDDLSVMTYLSYYMAEGSPGYKATLNWVRLQISPTPLDNFDKDWNNGFVLSSLVTSLGGQILNWPELAADWTQANDNAIQAAETQLGIVPVLTGRDLINPEVDHIAVMAHAAWHEARSREPPVQQSRPETPPRQSTVIEITSETPPDLSADVIINATWRIDTIMTIEVDSSQLGLGNLALSAEAPSGARTHLNKSSINEYISHFEFTPTEKGLWDVHVLYNGRAVGRSPYEVNVYDSALAKISREYGVTNTNEQYTFEVDTSLVGVDDVSVYVVHEGATVPHDVTADGPGKVQVDFTPTEEGSYTVAVYCGGVEIPGYIQF